MTRQKLNSFRSNQTDVSCWVLLWKHKIMCRKFPEIRSLSYFKRINGLEFWCLQIPLKVVTFWDQTKLAKSCPANFVPLKKFRVRNNERVTPSDLLDVFDAYIEPQFAEVTIICRNELYMWREYYGKYTFSLIKCLCLNQWVCFSKFLCYFSNSLCVPRSTCHRGLMSSISNWFVYHTTVSESLFIRTWSSQFRLNQILNSLIFRLSLLSYFIYLILQR